MTERHLYTNRLIHEKSPYLLQHAHNPVDWYPWGNEAFTAARDTDKPIFLSIGYATCHWCHVMEKECFEDPEIAQLMNEAFINIKVDREELPEVDSLYMEFAQSMMAGSAGWPLNVIITPELFPFFAATYLPPHNRQGLMGLVDLIKRIQEIWEGEERERILQQATKIVEAFAESVHIRGDQVPEKESIEDAADILFKMADPIYGGMKGAPKFPIGYQSNFMIHYSYKTEDSRALFLVERTLDMMQRGGIYDHLGGGFSRYSVDEKWLVPHFEKMLYDNALLAHAYLETWQLTKRDLYQTVTKEILDYILRDLTHPDGGFLSAEDADSEGHEGYFYTWKLEEVQHILGKEESALFCEFYNITEAGNFEGRNILNIKTRLEDFAAHHGRDSQDLEALFMMQKQLLWKTRERREHPFKDDKILSSWNGLTIFSMVEAGCAFDKKNYIESALKAARFIKSRLWQEGHLLRRWREGEASYSAGFDDYAFLIRGLISLFEAGCGTEWLQWATTLAQILERKFKPEGGAFYQTDGTDPNIILRKCQFSDGAEPSGNAIHCENLLRLYQLTLNDEYMEQAEDILKGVKRYIDNYPPGYSYHLIDLMRYYDRQAVTAVIALNKKKEWQEEIRQLLYQQFIPHRSIIWRQEEDTQLFNLIPFVKNQVPIQDKTTLYLCRQGACQKPINDLSEIKEAILKLKG